MLLQRAWTVFWKEWAAKHEYEELKEVSGWSWIWLCCARRWRKSGLKSIEMWPEIWFWNEAGFDFGWSDESECQASHKEEGTEKHRLYHCPEWYELRGEIPEVVRAKSENLKGGVEVAKRCRAASS